MALINPHINFNGNAEEAFTFYKEAFTFYKSVFGGEFAKIIRFKDLASPEFPVAPPGPLCPCIYNDTAMQFKSR